MHLTEQTDQVRPTVFRKCRTSCNNSVKVIQNYGKGGERGNRTSQRQPESYFDASLFLIYSSFFLSFFAWLFVFFFFSMAGNKLNIEGISCDLVCLCTRRSIVR